MEILVEDMLSDCVQKFSRFQKDGIIPYFWKPNFGFFITTKAFDVPHTLDITH